MASATKEETASAAEAIENARQYVAKMSEPSRTKISETLECNIENYESFFGHPLTDEKDPTMALLAEIPLPLEDMGGDLLMTNEEISRNIEILALEVQALKANPPMGTLNLPFDDCNCTVAEYHRGEDDEAEARKIHDLLLSVNGNPLGQMGEVLRELCEGGLFNSRAGFLDGETFEPFFAEHHWIDQGGSRLVAQMLDEIWKTVELENLLCEVWQGSKSIDDLMTHPRHGSLLSGLRKALVKP